MKQKYHYVYKVYADNLYWGRKLLGTWYYRRNAERMRDELAYKYGCCIVRKERKYI